MIKEISIKNYGVFSKETTIKLEGNFCTIIGNNGTGKTTIINLIKILFKKRKENIS